MKKTLLFSLSFVAVGLASAQTNLGFESWSGQDPDGWNLSSNLAASIGGPITVTKETASPGEGLNSAKMTVAACLPCGFAGFPDPMPGFIIQGVGYSSMPTDITFKWKGNIAAGDTAVAGAQVSQGTSTVIGTAYYNVLPGTSSSTWQTATVPFTYIPSPPTPDTIAIGAASDIYMLTDTDGDYSGHSTSTSTVFYVDDFIITSPAGIQLLETNNNLILAYPNPARDIVNFNLLGTDASIMEIVDMSGKVVVSQNNVAMKYQLNIADFNNGTYFVRFFNNQKEYIGTARFSVAK